jgi:hypothetical protein
MEAELTGTAVPPKSNFWSNPSNWADGTVPQSSNGLQVQLDANSTADVGSQASPFETNDIISVNGAHFLDIGDFGTLGFLHAHDIQGISSLEVGPGSVLDVRHDLVGVGALNFFNGGSAEIGHDIGSTIIGTELPGSSTLILDHPPDSHLDNRISVDPDHGLLQLELGHITFDHADFSPSLRHIELSNNGQPVYELTKVFAASASFGGVDPVTGNDILLIKGIGA